MSYSIDSRTIKSGDIFIPIKGERFDGHDFIEEVQTKGATVLEVELAEYAREKRKKIKVPIIAVTGSAGKTTVKDMLAAVLGQKFKVYKSPENNNNEIGVPLSLLNAPADAEVIILELAMRGLGQIEYLANIVEPTHAVITNIGYTHLELLHTREAIATAKSEVIRKGIKIFLNKKDDYYEFLQEQAEAKKAIIYTFDPESILNANAAAVTAVAKLFGVSEEEIAKALSGFQASGHRLRITDSKTISGVKIIDDAYNSNPDAVVFALAFLKEQAGSARKIAVLGDMKELGAEEVELHKKINVSGVDLVITYGELAKNIKHHKCFAQDQKKVLIECLKQELRSGDHVLVKGSRSMKMEEIIQSI